ncbi:MAG: aminotransferase class I/II-fold pyridoxal phosphate-dependent enzyme, partial [Eubacterium sp.]
MSRMVIETSVREAGTDPIFRVAGAAAKRAAEIGKESIVNSTIGALMDDEGDLVCFKSVYDTLKALPNHEIANYAPMPGTPQFREKVVEACFKSHKPEGHIRAVATPGGTGAIRHAIANYTEYSDKVLVPNWFWAPYRTIANENRRDIQEFEMFDEKGSFNIPSYKENILDLLEKQGRVLSIMNTPAHNPTGYSISDAQWKELVAFYSETASANPDKRLIVICDIAYIDFAGQGDDARAFMELLTGLPENVLILYAFSASKSFTMYGLRNGALICVAPTEEIAAEFEA